MTVLRPEQQDVGWLIGKARDWAQSVVDLYNTPVDPDMVAEKNKLLKRAKTIKESIEKITGPLEVFKELTPITSQLGVIPIIVGAVGIAAAGAAITYWYTSYRKFMEKVKLRKDLIAGGTSPKQAAIIAENALTEKSIAEKIFNPRAFFPVAALAVLGVYLWKVK